MEIFPEKNVAEQTAYFRSGATLPVGFRIHQLRRLKEAILQNESRIMDALWKDLRKSPFEAYATEIGIVLEEIGLHLRKLKTWAKPKKVSTNQMVHFWSSSSIFPQPYGRVLIMAPWNYPFQLLINPLAGAISAGNCVTLKASEYAPHTAEVMRQMITETFSPEYLSVYLGGRAVNEALLKERWDYIFFTGSPLVGKVVMEAAARNLTPVSLELGGKSPCIVDDDANLRVAAARIVWGKFLNAGQTCIAPDYLLVHRMVKDELLRLMEQKIRDYFGPDPEQSPDYPRIATEEKTERLARFLASGKVVTGGTVKTSERYFAPTILCEVAPDSPVMQEEIFGPILPVLEFSDRSEVVRFVNDRPKPLAFYYFSENSTRQREMLERTTSGGGCINEVVMHIANDRLPFGGVGNSGMGRYHGKASFDTFTHYRSILKKSTWFDVPVRYAPYGKKIKLLKMLIRP